MPVLREFNQIHNPLLSMHSFLAIHYYPQEKPQFFASIIEENEEE
jgi:hypothetical protein